MSGDSILYYAQYADITLRKRITEELDLAHSKLEIAFELSKLKMWEYDIQNDRINIIQKNQNKCALSQNIENSTEFIMSSGLLDPDSADVYTDMISRLKNGETPVQGNVKFKDGDGEYSWCRLTFTTILDDRGRPGTAIGVVQDISAEMEAKEQYELEAGFRQFKD